MSQDRSGELATSPDTGVGPNLDTNRCSCALFIGDEHTFVDIASGSAQMTIAVESPERFASDLSPAAPSGPCPVRPGSPARRQGPLRPKAMPAGPHLDHGDHRRGVRAGQARCRLESSRTTGATVRRRRMILGTVAVALLAALALPWGGAGGRPLATPGSALAGTALTAHTQYIVQLGDTLWSIALRLDPDGDPRPLVAQMAGEMGGDVVVPGEHLVLP